MNQFRLTLSTLFLILGSVFHLNAQSIENVETEIASQNDYELSIIRVYPDSFPEISVVFQAQNELGMPIWEMSPDELSITENGIDCELLRIRNISKEIPLNIGLVLDASGSMSEINISQLEGYFGPHYADSMRLGAIQRLYSMRGYEQRPWKDVLDYAKLGLKTFLADESLDGDSLQLVVFSHRVLSSVSLTTDTKALTRVIDSVIPVANTAFYDALMVSLQMANNSSGETVLIALTDGYDNASRNSVDDVVSLANEWGVKIYIIGLGRVIPGPLIEITDKTDGFFYYTEEPEQLTEIYRTIKKKIKSVYEVKYLSEHDDINDSSVDVQFSFVNDTLKFLNGDFELELPEEALAYIKKRDKIRQVRNVMIPVGIVSLIGLTIFGIRQRKTKSEKREELAISKVYPNPFKDSFSVDFQSGHEGATITDVLVFDERNQMVPIQWSLVGLNQVQVQLDKPNPGLHLVMLQTLNAKSQPVKIICNI